MGNKESSRQADERSKINGMNRVENALAHATETKALRIGTDILGQSGEMFQSLFPNKRAIIIADPMSLRVAGRDVQQSLTAAGVEQDQPHIFTSPNLHAEWEFVEELDAVLQRTDAIPVAVGSGTINDLTKLCSHRNGRRYMVVGTAASMDGYTSFGASITFEGNKQTFSCPAPLGVLADITVIAAAPKEMTASGYADLFAKIPAGADWIISDALGVEPLDERVFAIVQDGLQDALGDPEGVRQGTATTIEPLIEGLMLGGFAMQAHQTSRPASGADHQFSHLWNMEHHTMADGRIPPHGFQVSIGLLASTAYYEQFLRSDIAHLDVEGAVAAWPELAEAERYALELYAGTDFPEIGLRETRAKYIDKRQLREQLITLKNNWPQIKTRIERQIIPFAEASRRLRIVGAPTLPEEIGITRQRMRESVIRAQHIRRRFTILDVAVRTNLLNQWTDAIFGPGGVWEIE